MTRVLTAAYAVLGVVTFGHAWHHLDGWTHDWVEHVIGALFCAALHPLYWSVWLWAH